MTDYIIGFGVYVPGQTIRVFAGLTLGEQVLSAKPEDMHVFDRRQTAEAMRIMVEERTGQTAKVVGVVEGERIDG